MWFCLFVFLVLFTFIFPAVEAEVKIKMEAQRLYHLLHSITLGSTLLFYIDSIILIAFAGLDLANRQIILENKLVLVAQIDYYQGSLNEEKFLRVQ